ncbi:MAG: LacI family transcriptional regulator [Treponema sp.]|nr:LacI family transcriptional regulator [Treponema sp.]
MEKRATIKDIAKLAGVSLGSVHCALMGKEGVSKKTRERILNIAKKIDYRPNSSAAAIKRKHLQIAAVFPGTGNDNRFFYTGIWQGIRDFFNTVVDLNISCLEVPYKSKNGYDVNTDEFAGVLESVKPDGLLTLGALDRQGKVFIQPFIEKNVPVVLATNDIPNSGRLCCVQPEYRISGRMLAEFITRQIPGNAGILIWAGDIKVPSHYLIVEGFDSYMRDRGLLNPLYKVYSSGTKREDGESISSALREKKPAACCSVNARGSVLLGNAVLEAGLAGKIVAVGSDLFKENLRFLINGVFTNLLQKNSYMLAYVAAKYLVDFLVRDMSPPADLINVGSEIVFQSNASMFKNGISQLLL